MIDDLAKEDSAVAPFFEGTQVRLKSDPGRVGVCTGKSRERAGVRMVQVRLGMPTWYPEYELELLNTPSPDDKEAIRTGRFGPAGDLRRRLTHIQLSGGLADLVYSMNSTNTDFYAHQYKPVLCFLESPSNGLLIADEVGLGKTIEAGLIWTELRARADARRLLVVCPKMLCEKWRLELRNRFGVDARIVDAGELASELERPHPQFPASQAFIASMQGIRPPLDWETELEGDPSRRRLAKILAASAEKHPLFDLVIIDEAHYMRNPQTATHTLGQFLRDVTEHIVLLSATPINLKSEDLFSLLNLVDPDNFRYRDQFKDILAANEPLVKARLIALNQDKRPADVLAQVQDARLHPVLKDSKQLEALAEELSSWGTQPWLASQRIRLADRIERVNSLSRALTRTRKVDVTERKVVREPMVRRVQMSEPEGKFYNLVTEAIKEYAWENDISDGFLLATPQRQLSSCMYAAAVSWAAQDDQDTAEELLFEDLGTDSGVQDVSEFRRFLLTRIRGLYDLDGLRSADSKFHELSQVLGKFYAGAPSEKVVLFSYFRGTLHYLAARLKEIGIESIVLMGGTGDDKSEVIERFRTDSKVRILLSSEIASEGVDLQFCRFLVNYDLPWNPMKVEQRIGRIDRLGQKAQKIEILNFVYDDTIDSRIVQRLYERLDLFQRALGGMEAVLGEEIQKLTAELLTGRLTPEQEEQQIIQTALALEWKSKEERDLEAQAGQLIAHSDYILKRVHAAKDFSRQILGEDLVLYVRDYLERYAPGYRWVPLDTDGFELELTLPPNVIARFDLFARERRLSSLTTLAEGGPRRCRFINRVGTVFDGFEHINQFHPLVRFISGELQKQATRADYLISVEVPASPERDADIPVGSFAFVVHRWTFEGLRTEEAIRARVVNIDTGACLDADLSFIVVNAARLRGQDWPGAANELASEMAAEALEEADFGLIEDFRVESEQKEAENADRVQFQMQAIRAHRDRKVGIEQQRIQNLALVPRTRGLIVTAEEKIRELDKRFAIQMEKIKQSGNSRVNRETVSRGIVKVSGVA